MLAVTAPYYIACYGGFLCIENYWDNNDNRQSKAYTVGDVRVATPWDDFEAADAAAKWAVTRLYPPDLRYFAILAPTFGQFEGDDE